MTLMIVRNKQKMEYKQMVYIIIIMNPANLIQNRSVQLIFRDCLKLASRMVEDPKKVQAVRVLIRREFQKNRNQFDQQKIRQQKMSAVKGISNYIIHTIQKQHKLLNRKPINIMEQEDELQHLH